MVDHAAERRDRLLQHSVLLKHCSLNRNASLGWAAKRGHLANVGETTEVIGLYWHFVDVVWIVIFTLVYLLEYT